MDRTPLIEAILDLPIYIDCGDEKILVYPPSLGVSLMVERLQETLEINQELLKNFPAVELLAMAEKYPDEMCMIVALHTFKNRQDATDPEKLSSRMEELTMSVEDLASAYAKVMSFSTAESYMADFGLEKEMKRRKQVLECKPESTSIPTGAVTIYGSLIDSACNRYGWTFEYVLWGISNHNLRLLLADISNDIFLTDEEYKKARRYLRKEDKEARGVINADDPRNKQRIVELAKEME